MADGFFLYGDLPKPGSWLDELRFRIKVPRLGISSDPIFTELEWKLPFESSEC